MAKNDEPLNVRPLDDGVVVEPLEAEDTSGAASCCRTARSRSRSEAVCWRSVPAIAAKWVIALCWPSTWATR